MNGGTSVVGMLQVILRNVLIVQIKKMEAQRREVASPHTKLASLHGAAGLCVCLRQSPMCGQSRLGLPAPLPRVGLGPRSLLSFPLLCEQWLLLPLRPALPGAL